MVNFELSTFCLSPDLRVEVGTGSIAHGDADIVSCHWPTMGGDPAIVECRQLALACHRIHHDHNNNCYRKPVAMAITT